MPELLQPIELDRAQAKKERKKAYAKLYKAKNSDRIKAQDAAYKALNSDRIKVKNKAYKAQNSDRGKALQDAWTARNRDRVKAQQAAWKARNPDRVKAQQAAWRARNPDYVKVKNKKYYDTNRDAMIVRRQVYRQTNTRELHGCVDCKFWPDFRVGLPHYDSHCYRCFSRKFPDHPKVRTKERAEDTVKAYINANFAGFIHDHTMPTAHCVCDHRRRIDHRREVGNTLLCIETDEHHHRNYDKDDEDARYHDMLMGWGGKLCFIRFNPDGKGPPLEERLERLHAEITRHIGRLERGENSSYLEVWHLYYPEGTSDSYEEALAPDGL
jgi:hypothetical protein